MRVFLLLLLCSQLASAQPGPGFVTTRKAQFYLNAKPYYFVGANYWYGGLLAVPSNGEKGKQRLIQELDFLHTHGINNLRVLAGAEGKGLINGVERVSPPLQPWQGMFDEGTLSGLDFLLSEMGKRGMKAVLYLSNNWEWSGGFLQYLNWNGLLADTVIKRKPTWDELRDQVSQFYGCKPCTSGYLHQVEMILNHTNTYTGLKYTNDPAIMSWELANEPRPMRPAAIAAYREWILSAAALVRRYDSNHLLTIGTEGTIGTERDEALYKDIHSGANIDYLTIHIWPKNWAWYQDTSFNRDFQAIARQTGEYIQQHERIAEELQKPMVIEEFGLPRDGHSFSPAATTTVRDRYFRFILESWEASVNKKGALAGINFWAFGGFVQPIAGQLYWRPGNDYMGDPPQEEQGLNTVFATDESTWKIFDRFGKKQ